MARLLTSGFETQVTSLTQPNYGGEAHLGTPAATGFGFTSSGATFSTTEQRSGAAALDIAGAGSATFAFVSVLDRAYFLRLYAKFSDATPSAAFECIRIRAGTTDALSVQLETDGTLTLRDANGTQVGSASAALSDATYYRIQVKIIVPTAGSGTAELYLNDDQVATSSSVDVNNAAADNVIFNGSANVPHYYLDDLALNDDQGSDQNTYPGEGKIVLLKPVSDNAVGTGWTQPNTAGDDTTDLFASVDNTPPLGVAHSDADANALFYIFNDDNLGAASDYDANCQTYTDAGIDSDDTITLVQALVRVSTASATGTNTMTIQLVSNPADAGATTANAELTAVAGAESSGGVGWKSNRGALVYAPSVTKGTSPVVRATRSMTGITRAHMVDLMGVIVEYVAVAGGTGHTATPDDDVALSDARALGQGKGQADTLSLADLFARVTETFRTVPDTVALADEATLAKTIPLAINDTVSLADEATTAKGKVVAVDDSVALTDARAHARGLAAADSLALTDAQAKARGLGLADSLALTDEAAKAFGKAVADTLTLADEATPDLTTGGVNHTRDVDDTLALSDARAFGQDKAVSDTLALADSAAPAKAIPKAVDDTLSLSDSFSRIAIFERAVADTLSLADEAETSGAGALSLSDSVSLADLFARTTETQRTVADTLALADQLAAAADKAKALADTVALADEATPDLTAGGVNHTVDVDDTLALTDAVALGRGLGQADTVALSDARAFTRGLTQADALALTDNFSRLATYERTPSEQLLLADLFARIATAERTFADAVTLSDLIEPEVPGDLVVADVLALTDNFTSMLFRGEIYSGRIGEALSGSIDGRENGHISDTVAGVIEEVLQEV